MTTTGERRVDCGYLTVPENRRSGSTRTIELAVGILRADRQPPPKEPIVYLSGGPGQGALDFLESLAFDLESLLAERDLIVFDQRGTGYSIPALTCGDDGKFEEILPCMDRHRSAGIELSAYNSLESAADVAALRDALGYDSYNLYGISYGTRLALSVMRDHAEGLRAASIDGVMPPQADPLAEQPLNMQRAFELLLDACAKDAACAADYPDLAARFEETVTTLDASPAVITLADGTQQLLTGVALTQLLYGALYAGFFLPYFPLTVFQVAQGDYSYISGTLPEVADDAEPRTAPFAIGMNYAVTCADEASFTTTEAIDRVNAGVNPMYVRAAYDMKLLLDECRQFGIVGSDRIENAAVISSVPTLVTSGEFDPVTPPRYGDEAAKTLSKSHALTLAARSHGVTLGDCGSELLSGFLRDAKTFDASCASQQEQVPFVSHRSDRPQPARFARPNESIPKELITRIIRETRAFHGRPARLTALPVKR